MNAAASRNLLFALLVLISVQAVARADMSQSYELSIFTGGGYGANSGLSYLVQVLDTDPDGVVLSDQARFRILNNSTVWSSVITGIYFDDGAVLAGIDEIVNPDDPGFDVQFYEGLNDSGRGISPAELPGANEIGFETTVMNGAKLAIDAGDPSPIHGLNNDEYVDIIFDLSSGDVQTIFDMMQNETLRVGIHIQSLGDGGEDSASGVSIPFNSIPAPGAALLGALGLGLVGIWKRRERSRRPRVQTSKLNDRTVERGG